MAFTGRCVLVAGGAGNVGSGVVQSLLNQGAKVVVTSRSKERVIPLIERIPVSLRPQLSVIEADVSTEEGTNTIFEQATKQGNKVHDVLASIGSFWQKGKLVDQPLAEFNATIRNMVTGHFLLFKAFAPYLENVQGSTYTIITGNGGMRYFAPNISLLCVGSGALNGMAVAARAEHANSQLTVSEFMIQCLVVPKPDSELPQTNDFTVGNDLMGRAIAATIKGKARGQTNVFSRQDALLLVGKYAH